VEGLFTVVFIESTDHHDEAFKHSFAEKVAELEDIEGASFGEKRFGFRVLDGVFKFRFSQGNIEMERAVTFPIGSYVGVGGEDAILFDGLGGAASTEVLRAIGGDDDERKDRVVSLDDGRKAFGDGGATGGDNGARKASGLGATKGKEGSAPFFEMVEGPEFGMHAEMAHEHGVSSASAEDKFIATQGEEFGDDFGFCFQDGESVLGKGWRQGLGHQGGAGRLYEEDLNRR
jgi:hypothetical protein|tara:strand:+ start:1017 stop:1709 length:693 start_codon:yes stop_codon:yes gene_type:complete